MADFLVLNRQAYAVTGGMRAEACQVLSPTDLAYPEPAPSQRWNLRDALDRRQVLTTVMFGRTFNELGQTTPSDDDRPAPQYVLCDGYSVEAAEYPVAALQATMDALLAVEIAQTRMRLLVKYRSLPDVTATGLAALDAQITVAWTDLLNASIEVRLTSGGASPHALSAVGVPLPGSLSGSYDDLLGTWAVRFRMVKIR